MSTTNDKITSILADMEADEAGEKDDQNIAALTQVVHDLAGGQCPTVQSTATTSSK